MNVLSVLNLSKTVHDKPLFSGVNFGLDEGEHVALVGRNGVGKSTLLSIIAGESESDEGSVSFRHDSDVVMLNQHLSFREGETIDEYLFSGKGRRVALRNAYKENPTPELDAELCARDAWNLENDYHALLGELSIHDFSAPMETLSGGQLKKTAIARVLAAKPTILLLDEPTNHLDIETIEWLEKYLKRSAMTEIIITHDRYFLSAVATEILELSEGTIHTHPGSFTAYLERRASRLATEEKAQERLKSILRREILWMRRGAKARTGKDSGRKQRIEKMEDSLRKVGEEAQKQFTSRERRLGRKVLTLKGISKAYGSHVLFRDFSHDFLMGERVGLVGANGTGKSTLLDIIAGRRQPDSGTVERGCNTIFSVYDQRSRDLKQEKTITEYISDISERIRLSKDEVVSPSRFLEMFGFPAVMQRQSISRLSGGEKRRLYLVSKLLANPNFLLLDEPTNDLDLETMENLEQYIRDFQGCALIVSHDRAFLDQCCDHLFVLGSGRVVPFSGPFSEWERKEKEKEKEETKERKAETERRHEEKKGLSFREKKEYESLTEEIRKLEETQKRLEESFSDPGETKDGTLRERSETYEKNKILQSEKEERWLVLAEKDEATVV